MKRSHVTNADIARALREMALLLELEEVPFKPQAYEAAAYSVTAIEQPVAKIYAEGGKKALMELPRVGEGIAGRIAEMLDKGAISDLERMRKKVPVDILELTAVEGIGPKKARALWRGLGVRNVAELKKAAEHGRVRTLPRFGERSERRIFESIAFHEQASGRRPLGEALEIARHIEEALAEVPGVERAVVAGSIRRHRETIGDVDVLVATDDAAAVSRAFESLPQVQAVHAHGPTKTLVRLANGMDADLRVIPPDSFGAALLYFTGSKAHNVALRKIARQRGLKLNEYGLFRDRDRVAARSEEEVYEALGMAWIPPELRENTGEIALAQADDLPAVVDARDVRGDLQVHTNWTDGSATIEEMARAAQALGLDYIVITDHTRDLAMTGGLDERKLRAQMKEVREVDRRMRGIRVLAGAEVNIREDGSLDIEDDVLAELDVVGAAVHSHFDQSHAEMTRRIVRAVENPHVDILFHPLGRALGRRRAVSVDFAAVVDACRRTGTVLEIDAQPERLDLPDALVRDAVEAGVLLAIDSDAHSVDELHFVETFGVGVARRGWAESKDVINTWPVTKMLGALKDRRSRGANAKRRRARAGA